MSLVNLKTNLKSLKFGKDRPGGGSSNQPYIKPKIGDTDGLSEGPDFLVRGGTSLPERILKDEERLLKMFTDFKSLNGIFFTGKQNLLSRTAIPPNGRSGLFLNEGIYSPTQTLIQAASTPFGIHVNKQGLIPFDNDDPLGYVKYLRIKEEELQSEEDNGTSNRLYALQRLHLVGADNSNNSNISKPETSNTIFTYSGGPGSLLGIGRTSIRFAGNRIKDISGFKTLDEKPKNTTNKITYIPKDFRNSQTFQGEALQNVLYERRVGFYNRKNEGKSFDQVNELLPYYSESVDTTIGGNDLIKFRIAIIDNNNPNMKTFIHFRAFIDSFNDNTSANWNSHKFVGRGEELFKYQGFQRSISMGWTLAASSKAELIPMYRKLNSLQSSLAPSYSQFGYMGGNIVQLTVGGYLYEQPGIIRNLNVSLEPESPWEVAIPYGEGQWENSQNGSKIYSDESVKELPHILRVSGFEFVPIHRFVPKVFEKNEHFISLTNGHTTNY